MRVSLYKKLGSFFVTIVLLGAFVAAALNAQLIKDTYSYYQFKPDETIASFAELTGMSDYGTFMFYTSHPSLENAETFNQVCDKEEKTAAVLGCYNGQNIFIYNITDPRLDGIRPTTAAHEMLHAAYQRLSNEDREVVNELLEAEYAKLKDDQELSGRMAFYAETQPGDRANELHSIIGTEISEISSDLEIHYGRYFSDRSKVVAQHKKYHSVFEELRSRADVLSAQIEQLGQAVEGKKASYDTQAAALQNDIEAFNARADRGDFRSQAAFNAERQVLIVRTSSLDALRAEINNDVNYYNSLVNELNGIAVETDVLNHSIDSSLEPAPSL